MARVSYVGRAPDSDSAVVHKSWSDAENLISVVGSQWVGTQVAAAATAASLQTPAYVDSQDNLRAKKTAVDAADAAYVPSTSLGAANGVASLTGAGVITASQVPTSGLVTERITRVYTLANGITYLNEAATQQVDSTDLRAYRIATITIPDQGWPWIPIPFGWVGGYATGTTQGGRSTGTFNHGIVNVVPPSGVSDIIYGTALCTGVPGYLSRYPILPGSRKDKTPTTNPPITGSLELSLWGAAYFGSGAYMFHGTGLQFDVMAVPAVVI